MKTIVLKFGGSNLKSREDFARLIRAVQLYRTNDPDISLVIVVSALYGVTDVLINSIRRVCTDEQAVEVLKKELISAHVAIIDLYMTASLLRETTVALILSRVEELEKYLRGIHYIGDIPDFVADRIQSYGERLSSFTLTAILNEREILCREVLPESMGLIISTGASDVATYFVINRQDRTKAFQALHGEFFDASGGPPGGRF